MLKRIASDKAPLPPRLARSASDPIALGYFGGILARFFNRFPPTVSVTLLFVGLVLPQALLGLPIAAAAVGPLPALVALGAIGALMTLTAASEAEALTRDGDFQRQGGFFGQLVQRYLGGPAAAVPNLLAGLRTSMSVLASYVGLSVTLAILTGLPRVAIGAVAFTMVAILLLRGGLKISPSIGASLGLVCLPILLAVGLIAAVSGGGGLGGFGELDGASMGALIGVTVMLYISNVYVVGIAREVLPEQHDGRALIRGSAIGTMVLTVIAGLWLVATSLALEPDQLSGQTGTVLGPLAGELGAVVTVLSTALTLLILGLGIERTSVAVMRLAAERMPGDHARFAAFAPLAVCVVGEVLLAADAVTFSEIFAVTGVATNIVLAIAVPAMLVLASRNSGDLDSAISVPLLGRPWAVGGVVVLAALSLVLFATVLADSALLRIAAAVSLAALTATTGLALRSGAFNRSSAHL